MRERFTGPTVSTSVIDASFNAPYALSHAANEAFSPAITVALSAVSLGTAFGSAVSPFSAEHVRSCASVT